MSQGNGAQKGNLEDIDVAGKTPLEMVQEQHKKEQQNLQAARDNISAEAHNSEIEDQRVEADEEVPGRSVPSDIRHHPQRNQY